MIYFRERFRKKFNSFIDNIDKDKLEVFTQGFYQLLNQKVERKDKNIFLDNNELFYFLNEYESIEERLDTFEGTEEIAFFLTKIAQIYASVMIYDKALFFFQEVITLRKKYLGEKSLEMAQNYQMVAAIHEQLKAFDQALIFYKKSLAIRKELSYVKNNLLVAESYNRLALVYYYLEYYTLALDYIEDSIRIREKVLPSGHYLLENSYYNYSYIKKEIDPKEDHMDMLFKTILKLKVTLLSRLIIFK
jgi:tetratricopeptide (TPR) repeat protein